MSISSSIKALVHQKGIHPHRWLAGLFSYSRFLGYVKPELMTASEQEYQVRRKLFAKAWQTRQLTAPVGERLLVLCPHPDDESIGAGGLLLAHRDIAEIHLACLCSGDRGGLEGPEKNSLAARQKMIQTRRAEFQKAAEALNAASIHHFEYPDGDIPYTPTALKSMRRLVVETRADTVLLPWFLDDQPDHRRTNVLYAWACSDLEVKVLAYEIWSMLEPNAVFDITSQLPTKLSLIENYQSQLRTVDYSSYAAALARVRAYHASLAPRRDGAAEAFIGLPNADYCELVCAMYGLRGRIRDDAASLLDLKAKPA